MKLILKIAAGIIVAWVLILGTGLIVGLMTAKALTEGVVQPQVDEITEPFDQFTTGLTPPPTKKESTELLGVGYDDCTAQGGFPGWNYKEGVANCLVRR